MTDFINRGLNGQFIMTNSQGLSTVVDPLKDINWNNNQFNVNGFGTYSRSTTPNSWFGNLIGSTPETSYTFTPNQQLQSNLLKNVNYSALSPEMQQQFNNNILPSLFSEQELKTLNPAELNAKINSGIAQMNNNSGSEGLFNTGTDKYGNKTFGGGTALQWGALGLQTAAGLYGMYNAHKSMKLAKQNFEEQKALNRANYKMQARSFNNSLRNQQSGRGFVGMSGAAMRQLGREYDARKASETY